MKLILSDKQLNLAPLSDDVAYFNLASMKIANCIGCFGCWVKTPGKCVLRDDAVKVYPIIAKSDNVIYVSKIIYGGYDVVMKRMLERAIPIQQAFIRIVDGETHHLQRAVAAKNAKIVAYGNTCDEEKRLFEKIVARNAKNMNFSRFEVIFAQEKDLDEIVNKELENGKNLDCECQPTGSKIKFQKTCGTFRQLLQGLFVQRSYSHRH